MERTFTATAAAILITAALVLSAIALSGGFSESENAAVKTENVPVNSESESPSEKMILGIYSGHIALFIGDGRYPNEIYEALVRTLPESDRLRLQNGIEINSEEELRETIEDLTS